VKPLARRLGLSCLLCALGLTAPARGWSASGHMQIALLAYDGLPSETRRELDQLLLQHPRFNQDFVPQVPPELAAEARARWIFAFASTWPDVVRGQAGFEHPTWHYVNLRLKLRGEQLVSCGEARRAWQASEREQGAPTESIVSALPWSLGVWADRARPGAERALALSWLLHLVGDAHQPLHAVALFTDARFVAGDRGGNEVLLRGRASLHRVWDGLLGDAVSAPELDASVRALAKGPSLAAAASKAARQLDVDAWLDEDCALARSFVYVPAVLGAVRRFEREQREGKPEVSLRDAYVEAAKNAARVRAVEAAARLRALLAKPAP